MKLSCLRLPKGVEAFEVAALPLPPLLSLKVDMTG